MPTLVQLRLERGWRRTEVGGATFVTSRFRSAPTAPSRGANVPVYQVVTSGVELSKDQRDALAKRFTAVHHEVTQAPEPFIRIVFQPMPLGLMYTAGEIAPSFILVAGCRGGRSDATRHELMNKHYAVVREVTDLPPDQIVIIATDTPPSWVMEAGLVLPETNHEAEAAWMKKLQAMFPGRYDDYE
jgi:phenylpyruvate tautomerase PptA (4-oxalocrotonate tautomerase family)